MNTSTSKQQAEQQRQQDDFEREMLDIVRERRGESRLPEFRDAPQLSLAERSRWAA